MAQTPEQLREQILKNISKLNEKDAKTHREMLATAKESNDEAAQYNVILRSTQEILDEVSSSFSYIIQSIKDQNNELSKGKSSLLIQKAALNKIQDISRTSLDIRRGETVFEENKFKKLQEQARIKREDLETSLRLKGGNDDALKSQIEDAKELERGMELVANTDKKINKELGFGINLVSGFDKALAKLGLPELGFKDALDKTKMLGQEAASNGKEAEKNFSAAGTYVKQFTLNLKEALTIANLLTLGIGMVVMALIQVDKSTSELAKSLGTSYKEASKLSSSMNDIANSSEYTMVNTKDVVNSQIKLSKALGTSKELSKDLLDDFTGLTKQAGYSEESMLAFGKIVQSTGGDLSDMTQSFLGQVELQNKQNGLSINSKDALEGASKASSTMVLSLGRSGKALGEAVFEATALGVSLSKVEQIAGSLLQFETSISNELEAELLTGKDLNLEKARTAALNHEYGTVAKEIAKQVGTAAEFTKMNTIQQEALAKAVGMTSDDLATSLMSREALIRLGKEDGDIQEEYNKLKKDGLSDDVIADRLGSKKLAAQLRSNGVAEDFKATMEKVKEVFVSLVTPLLPVLGVIGDIASMLAGPLTMIGKIVKWTGDWGKGLLVAFGIFKGIAFVTKGMTSLNAFLIAQNAIMTKQKTAQVGLETTKLGLGEAMLITLGLQDAVIAYQMAKEEGIFGFAALRAAMEETTLGSLILQGGALFKNLGKYIALTLQTGYRMVMENTIVGSLIAQGAGILKNIGIGAIKLVQSIATAAAELLGVSALTLGIGTVVALAAAAGGIAYLYSVTKGDDVRSGGYGQRTFFDGKDTIALNDQDQFVAGTDLMGTKKREKSNSESPISSASPSIDITPLIDRMSAVEGVLVQILNKEFNVYLDSTKIGTGFAVSTVSIQ